jgi:hypothetical protein
VIFISKFLLHSFRFQPPQLYFSCALRATLISFDVYHKGFGKNDSSLSFLASHYLSYQALSHAKVPASHASDATCTAGHRSMDGASEYCVISLASSVSKFQQDGNLAMFILPAICFWCLVLRPRRKKMASGQHYFDETYFGIYSLFHSSIGGL